MQGSVFTPRGPLFILLGLKVFLGGKAWFGLSLCRASRKGMLRLPGRARMNR